MRRWLLLGVVLLAIAWYLDLLPEEWDLRPWVTDRANCDASYPTVCISPPPPLLECKDLTVSNFQVFGKDPHHFDPDQDGVGCER